MSAPTLDPDGIDTIALPVAGAIGLPDVEAPDTSKGRPTSRAGRQATAAANRAKREAKAAAAAERAARPKITAPRKGNVADSVKGLHELAGGLVLPMAGLPATGAALAAAGPDAGKAWAALAQRYPAIERLFTGGGDGVLFVTLLMAYLPVITTAAAESKTPKSERASLDLGALFGAALVPEQAQAPATEQGPPPTVGLG